MSRGLVALLFCCERAHAALGAGQPRALSDSGAAGRKATLHRVDLERFPMARCLDGTPGAFYVSTSAAAEGSDKWVVWHTGGGWCSVDVPLNEESSTDHCLLRRMGSLGSSRHYQGEVPVGWTLWGFEGELSEDPSVNPLMHDWNKVVLVYCDGGSFSGQREQPYEAQLGAPDLFFRGRFVLEAIIDTLISEHGLASATDLVISGGSAGGLATILHADFWADRVRAAASPAAPPFIVALPESGVFLDWDLSKGQRASLRYNEQMRRDFAAFNAKTVQGCESARRSAFGDVADCFLAEHALPYVRTPTFLLQSVVDSWQLHFVLGETKDQTVVNAFRQSATSRLLDLFSAQPQGALGGFVDSCAHHCQLWDELTIDGTRKADAFTQWFQARKLNDYSARSLWWQAHEYPCLACCGAGSSDVEAIGARPSLRAETDYFV